ncbi:MAG TPA: hypothetical protein VMY42_08040 [Thermoguttaceae bacterium]|nr:hypothetical protein [Thermoguttaceae bacterium]
MLSSLASAAPAPVRIGDRDFLLSPLSDRDFDELSLWYQGRVLRIARASLDADSTSRDREETLKAAYAHASSIDFFSEFQTGGLLSQKEALAQFVWRVLRKQQPAFSLDDARKLVTTDTDSLAAIMDIWHLLQFGKAPAAAVGEEGPEKNVEGAAAVSVP